MKNNYLVVSGVGTDNITFPNGLHKENLPGGAGFYALVGFLIWTENVLILSNVGPEYLMRHEAWYKRNSCSTKGLSVQGQDTPISEVVYLQDGEREDRPNIGLEEFRKSDASLQQIRSWISSDTRGVYFFKALDEAFLDGIITLSKMYGFKTMWEVSADAAIPENREKVEKYIQLVDVFSINSAEARKLYGLDSTEEIIRLFHRINRSWIYFRQGSKGAYVLVNGETYNIPSVTLSDTIDPTGAGNSSSTGMFYGVCQGTDPIIAGLMGSVSAAFTIKQFGPPDLISAETREEAESILGRKYSSLRGEGYAKPI